MIKRIKWTNLVWCLLILTVIFAAALLHSCSTVQKPQSGGWEITVEKAAQPVKIEKVNVNTADSEMLQTLPGIGEALAGRIISYREENGPFETADDLMAIKGIGEETLKKFCDYITFEEVRP